MARKHLSRLALALSAAVGFAVTVPGAVAVAAVSTGTLFGLNASPGAVFAIDPDSGGTIKVTDLPSDPSGVQPATFFGLASNSDRHQLFTVRGQYTDFTFATIRWQVITIDSHTGAASVSPALAQDLPNDLAFDPSSASLIGITGNQAPQSVVRVDPATGAMTHIADLPGQFNYRFAYAATSHTLYVPTQEFIGTDVLNVVVSVDTASGTVSQSGPMTVPLDQLVYDSASGALFGKGGPWPGEIFEVDPSTGAQRELAPALGTFFWTMSIDPSSHKIFVKYDDFPPQGGSELQFVQTIDDLTGDYAVSASALNTDFDINTLAFEGASPITPDSLAADVRQAFASGAIGSQGLELAILGQLSAAANARARGDCVTAANIYEALINTIRAQSGKSVDPDTASRLITEIQFLIDHCP